MYPLSLAMNTKGGTDGKAHAYTRKNEILMAWAQKDVRKKDDLAPLRMRIGAFLPFYATDYLNGHDIIGRVRAASRRPRRRNRGDRGRS